MESSSGNASVTPTPRRNVRRGRCFFVMNMLLQTLLKRRDGCYAFMLLPGLRSPLLDGRGGVLFWRAEGPYDNQRNVASRVRSGDREYPQNSGLRPRGQVRLETAREV